MKFRETVTYDDMLLVPQYSDITSRSEVNISSWLNDTLELKLPIIASPMDTVSEVDMSVAMAKAGGLAVIHRYNSIPEQGELVHRAASDVSTRLTAAAVGVTGDFLELATTVVSLGANVLCVDVAHGHHLMMKQALSELRKAFGDNIYIIAGNVCTLEGVNDVSDWGLMLYGAILVAAPFVLLGLSQGTVYPVSKRSSTAPEQIVTSKSSPTAVSKTQETL